MLETTDKKCQLVSNANFLNRCIINFYADAPMRISESYHP